MKAAGALLEWPDLKVGRAPAALNVVIKREFHQVQMRPAEIAFSIQLLKIQEPWLPLQMVSLVYGCPIGLLDCPLYIVGLDSP